MRRLTGVLVALLILSSSFIIPFADAESLGFIGTEWADLNVIEYDDYLEVQGIDSGFTMRFYNGTQGYNSILKEDSVLVQDERWFLEYRQGQQWRPRGIPQNVFYEIISPMIIEVVRVYDDYLGTEWNITYILFGGSMPKIIFNGTLTDDEYRLRWALSGINKDYYEQDVNQIKLYNSTEAPFIVDYQDVFNSKGNITEIDYGGWGSKKIDINFNIGDVSGYFELDPSFGFTSIFANVVGSAGAVRAFRANLTETACVYSMSVYVGAFGANFQATLGIYDSLNMSTPENLLGQTINDTVINAIGWWNLTMLENITLFADTYWLALNSNESVNQFRWEAGEVDQRADDFAVGFPVLSDPFGKQANFDQRWSIFANYTVGACDIFYLTSLFFDGISDIDVNGSSTSNLTETAFNRSEIALGVANADSGFSFLYWDNENVSHIHDITITKTMLANSTITAYAIAAGGGGVAGVSMLALAIIGAFVVIVLIGVIASRKR